MPGRKTSSTKKFEAREVLTPLFYDLAAALKGRTVSQVAEASGISKWQTGRLMSWSVSSPTFLDMVRLLRVAGISPNQAARKIGLLDEDEAQDLSDLQPDERELVAAMRLPEFTPEERRDLLRRAVNLADAQLLLSRSRELAEQHAGERELAGVV